MWVGARRYASDLVAFALMLWFAFGTLLRPAAYNFAPDVLSSLLVVGAIVALLYGRCVVAGLLLGLSVWAKWTNAIFFPVAVLALAARRDWRSLWRFGAAAALPIAGLLGLNCAHVRLAVRHALRSRADRRELSLGRRTVAPDVLHGTVLARAVDAADAPDAGLVPGAPPFLLALPGFALFFRRARSGGAAGRRRCMAQLATVRENTSSGTCPATGRASCCPSWP